MDGSIRGSLQLMEVLYLYWLSTRMMINTIKSIMYSMWINAINTLYFYQLFSFQQIDLKHGFLYLCFFLKPNGHGVRD